MKLVRRLFCFLWLASAMVAAQDARDADPAGEWLGMLDVGAAALRLLVQIESADDGTLTATLNSVDQGAVMPVDSIEYESGTLTFAIAQIDGAYEGTMDAEGRAIEGTWSQGGRDFPLTFERLTEPFALERPQTPEPPFPYESRDVTVRNQSADIELACTFLLPQGEGPFPAVLFLTGSGAQDRNETLMGHQPFLVIADHLGRRGVASLRCDDRGIGGSGGNVYFATAQDAVADAVAGIGFLSAQPEVDPEMIGVIGHSEGGLVAPAVAVADDRVGFLVLLAAPGVPMDEVIMQQARDALAASGAADSLIERVLAAQEEDFALLQDESLSREEVVQRLTERAEALEDEFTEEELELLDLSDENVEQSIQQLATPWFRSLIRQAPAENLRQLDVPVLALFGEKDVQVRADMNARPLEEALESAPTDDYTVRVLPELNHLFQHAETGAIAEYGTITETFAPEALQMISDWIVERAGR